LWAAWSETLAWSGTLAWKTSPSPCHAGGAVELIQSLLLHAVEATSNAKRQGHRITGYPNRLLSYGGEMELGTSPSNGAREVSSIQTLSLAVSRLATQLMRTPPVIPASLRAPYRHSAIPSYRQGRIRWQQPSPMIKDFAAFD
jgi:hypothetical protein